MAYQKTVWENLPSTNTPLNASNLNKIENELEALDKSLKYNGQAPENLNNARTFGTYIVSGVKQNAPFDSTIYGILLVYISDGTTWTPNEGDTGASWIWQELRIYGDIYQRHAVNTSNSWSNWYKLNTNVIEESTLTVNNNYFSTVDINKIRKNGRTVIVDFRGLVSNDIPYSASNILNVQSEPSLGSAECGTFYIGNEYGDPNFTPKWFFIDNKSIKMPSVLAGNWIHIHHVYMTNE